MDKEKLQWHPAFYAVTQIELEKERSILDFEEEHPLSKKPMVLDLLIIKKKKGRNIDKNIGQIFRGHNIIEYKCPEDYLSINDYYKVMGYASFYQANTEHVCEIDPEDVTITLVESHYPKSLFGFLHDKKGMRITKKEAGIYYVEGNIFPTQVIVTTKLSADKNFWLSRLRADLSAQEDIAPLAEAYRGKENQPIYAAAMDLIMKANWETAKEAKQEMCEAIRELFADEWKVKTEEWNKEAEKREAETKKREAETKKREAETKKREAETKKREAEAEKREAEAEKREAEARKQEAETREKLKELKELKEKAIQAVILDYSEEGFTKGRIIEKLQKRFELDEKSSEGYYQRYAQ